MIFLGIGSNLPSDYGDRFFNINLAMAYLDSYKIKIIKTSSFYETPSYPNQKNPKFLNVCLEIKTQIKPEALLKKFKSIEKKLERIKGTKNQPRTCDIDIIDYENRIINTNDIIIPHPRAHLRNFVLYPLNEISPKWTHPITNKKIDFLIKKLNFKLRNEITKIKEHVTVKQ